MTKEERKEAIIRYVTFYGTLALGFRFRYEMTTAFYTVVGIIRSSDPIVAETANILKDAIVLYLGGFNTAMTLRFLLMWFPNINPFIQPYYIIRVITEPKIEWVRKRIPKIFGMDLSFLVLSYAITYAVKYLTMFRF